MKLSILDQSIMPYGESPEKAFAWTGDYARLAEELGYHRFWVSEHHGTKHIAGSAPEVLIAHLAANTTHIRVGSGAVLLPHYSAFKVAEVFEVLASLYKDRIDLGLGRAPGAMPNVTRALHEGGSRNASRYPGQLKELLTFLSPEGNKYDGLYDYAPVTPRAQVKPAVWILGSSRDSAKTAAENGLPFCFAHFINPDEGFQAADYYHEHFQPSGICPAPYFMLAVSALAAESEQQAEEWRAVGDYVSSVTAKGLGLLGIPSYEMIKDVTYMDEEKDMFRKNRYHNAVGTIDQVEEKLKWLEKAYSAEEIMTVGFTPSFEEKAASMRRIANRFKINNNQV